MGTLAILIVFPLLHRSLSVWRVLCCPSLDYSYVQRGRNRVVKYLTIFMYDRKTFVRAQHVLRAPVKQKFMSALFFALIAMCLLLAFVFGNTQDDFLPDNFTQGAEFMELCQSR